MITEIIKLLRTDEFTGVDESVEIAKGKYELSISFRELKHKIKRLWQGRHTH